jgi:hypothetical protein
MELTKYRQLEIILAKYNECMIELYGELIELVPPQHKPILMQGLRLSLIQVSEAFRIVSDMIFQDKIKP